MIWTILPLVILINLMYLVLNWKKIKRYKAIEKQPRKSMNDNIVITIGYIHSNWGNTWQWSVILILLINFVMTILLLSLFTLLKLILMIT